MRYNLKILKKITKTIITTHPTTTPIKNPQLRSTSQKSTIIRTHIRLQSTQKLVLENIECLEKKRAI